MSAPTAPSLLAYARSLGATAPGTLPPRGGHPLPDTARASDGSGPRVPYGQARETVTRLLRSRLTAPDTARAAAETERALIATGAREHVVFPVAAALEPGDPAAARALARRLVRGGTTVHGVVAGLGLLERLGEPEDVPYVRALGTLHGLARYAVGVLDPLDRVAAALMWLTHRPVADVARRLVEDVTAGDHTAVRERLLGLAADHRRMGPDAARRMTEATALVDLLARSPEDTALLAQAVRLLVRTTTREDHEIEIARYADALALYGTVAERAHLLPREPGHQARLLTLAQELHSGASRLLDWPSGLRETVLGRLLDAVGEPADPDGGHRADWIRRTARHLRAALPDPAADTPRLRIEVAVPDPGDRGAVETRLLVDGRPILPEIFAQGPGDAPEQLVDTGSLRAGPEPREVRLAEAHCTEGCCGALYTTVSREGPHVVWSGWRRSGRPLGLPAYRFDADAYDAEVARAERDHDWTWPARRTGRLITAGLRDRPDLLTRWGLRPGWISTYLHDPDTTVVTFAGPPPEGAGTAAPRSYTWRLPDDGTPPRERAARALRRMAEEDPRSFAQRP
ncbi:hypothetical protein ACIQNV_29545 [Streptomyces hydrogenans]|uniref:hypothetical protein n=1 Tax=Streptomyces hydrogenans TaxID=1873719 RepID=UPI0034180AA8